jgi:plasmid stabilization system protein ParE
VRYDLRFDPVALNDVREFLSYLAEYDPEISARYEIQLETIFEVDLSEHPLRFSWFWLSGPPYRGRLFQVSRRTKFWIIYTVDEMRSRVDVLRFWNASRDPTNLRL